MNTVAVVSLDEEIALAKFLKIFYPLPTTLRIFIVKTLSEKMHTLRSGIKPDVLYCRS